VPSLVEDKWSYKKAFDILPLLEECETETKEFKGVFPLICKPFKVPVLIS
jgi:hypothetical protein